MGTLRDIMTTMVITLGADMSLEEAEERLTRHRVTGAPVMQGGRVVGVLSRRDLAAFRKPAAKDVGDKVESPPRVKDAMTRQVVALPPSATPAEAAALMQREHIHRVLVMQGDYLLGVVSKVDLARTAPAGSMASTAEAAAPAA